MIQRQHVLIVLSLAAATVSQQASSNACLAEPVQLNPNLVVSPFGKPRSLGHYGGKTYIHWGVDFQARNPANRSVGAELKAVDNATVVGAGFWGSGYGNRVILRRDNGDLVIYSHMEKIEPRLKSGGSAVGFRGDAGADAPGTTKVASGEKIGIAGGTATHAHTDEGEKGSLPIHLHLEYATGYSGYRIREMGGGSGDTQTRSRYYRDVRQYMCKTVPHTADAKPEVAGTGGKPANPIPSTGNDNPNAASSDEQAATAQDTQGQVGEDERYGMPDLPPYADYEGMSESQIIDAETTRRALDTEWETGLVKMHTRGLWMEITRMEGVRLWIKNRLADKWARVESMYAALLAQEVNQFYVPQLASQSAQLQRMTLAKKIR